MEGENYVNTSFQTTLAMQDVAEIGFSLELDNKPGRK